MNWRSQSKLLEIISEGNLIWGHVADLSLSAQNAKKACRSTFFIVYPDYTHFTTVENPASRISLVLIIS